MRDAGLPAPEMPTFSCSIALDSGGEVEAAPELTIFDVAFNARLGGAGLFGDVRWRRRGFDETPGLFLADRNESFTLGRNGVASGDCG